MKIVYLYHSLAVKGGIERILADKMNYLVNHGYKVYLITSDQGNHEMAYPLDSRVRCLDLDIKFHTRYKYRCFRRMIEARQLSLLYKERLRKSIKEISPDIICCTTFQDIHSLLKIKGNIPLVVESHVNFSHPDTMLHHIQNIWNHYWIGKAEAVVTLTDGDAAKWNSVSHNVHVIPNIVYLNNTPSYSDCTEKRVLFVGRFTAQKGLEELFAIWNRVHEKYPEWALDMYGDGELWDVYSHKAKEIDNNIHVYKSTKEIAEVYKKSSILVLTSVYEPFGLVIPEAMSCGLPVVSYDSPYGPASIISDGEDGYVIPMHRRQAFADRLCQLMGDEELRKEMGKRAIASSQRFSAERIMPMWKKLFNQLTSFS